MGNPVVHWELMSKEPQKVADFYARIFGWKPRARCRASMAASSSPTAGKFSLFTDPEGRMMGLWKAKQR